MPEDASVPHPKLMPRMTTPRARLAVVLVACVAVALVGTSILNRSRWALRCEDGQLVAYRGLSLPFGYGRLDPDTYPAVGVAPATCEDVVVSSQGALEEHYLGATMHRIDTAIRSDDASELESAAQVIDQLIGSSATGGGILEERRRALIVALLRADVRAAETSLGHAQGRLRAAREAGVSEEVLGAMETQLQTLCGGLASPRSPRSLSALLSRPDDGRAASDAEAPDAEAPGAHAAEPESREPETDGPRPATPQRESRAL